MFPPRYVDFTTLPAELTLVINDEPLWGGTNWNAPAIAENDAVTAPVMYALFAASIATPAPAPQNRDQRMETRVGPHFAAKPVQSWPAGNGDPIVTTKSFEQATPAIHTSP